MSDKTTTLTYEPPDIMLLTWKGETLPAHVVEAFKDMYDEQNKNGLKEIKVLMDFSELENIPPEAREIIRVEGFKFHIVKMSVFGASSKMKSGAGLIMKMQPNIKEANFFDTEKEARAWLAD